MAPKRPAAEAAASEVVKKQRVACTWAGCLKDFGTKSDLNVHIRTVHERKGRVACTWPGCLKDFATQATLNKHIRTVHKKEGRVDCTWPGCQKDFGNKSALTTHIRTVHKKEKHTCTWPGCGDDFTTKASLERHVGTVHGTAPRVVCTWPGCKDDFSGDDTLKQHIRQVHEKKRHFCTWPGCQASYAYRPDLENHRYRDHGDTTAKAHKVKDRHACTWPGCQRTFRHRVSLDDHRYKIHRDLSARRPKKPTKYHSCTWPGCPKRYRRKASLNFHIRTVHKKQRFACTWPGCPKRFVHRRDRATHAHRIHGDTSPATLTYWSRVQKRKQEVRQILADKEAKGLCSATQSCPHPAVESSFHCQIHEKILNVVAKALEVREEKGTLRPDSIQSPMEFNALLQRPEISLDKKYKQSLSDLARGLDDVQRSSRAFVMDTEFIHAKGGFHVPLDITVMRLNGEEIISTRMDWDMTTDELRRRCINVISRKTISKVYGKTGRT